VGQCAGVFYGMQLELKPDVERRVAAHAAAAGRTVAEYLEGLIERNLPEGCAAQQTTQSEEAKGNFTPLQLSFSLWLRDFVNAALTIDIIISVACMLGLVAAFLTRNQMSVQILYGLMTLALALATFSHIATAALAVLSGLRHAYARYRLKGVIAAVMVGAAYLALGCLLIDSLLNQDLKSRLAIMGAIVLTLMSGAVATWGIINSDPQKYRRSRPRRKLTRDDFLSLRWNPNLHEDVKEVYVASKAASRGLKGASEVANHVLPTDIGGDFKAWHDAMKLLITILTGLTIISSLFTNGNGIWDQAIKILMLFFLLVPALSCAYMESFRRQCERHWQALAATQEGT